MRRAGTNLTVAGRGQGHERKGDKGLTFGRGAGGMK